MGCKELIESLRQARDEKVIAIWDEAEREADRIKAEALLKAEQVRADFERRRAAAAGEKAARALSDASSAARTHRLNAEKELSDRLFSLAAASLAVLRRPDERSMFAALAAELPPFSWKTVRVNPGDAALAKELFPGAEIVPENTITGGMDVMTGAGKVRVVNTLEKRLERAWPEVLPEMIRDVYEELSKR